MKKRLVILAGGTGGHLYPAQALAEQIQEHYPQVEILFVGGGLQSNRCFDSTRFAFSEISVTPFFSKNPFKLLKGGINLLKSIKESFSLFKKFKPDVVVGFGSYHTVPSLIVGKWMQIPLVLHEANSIPGKANRWLGSLVNHVGVHFPLTGSYFPKNNLEIPLPLRKGYHLGALSKEEALSCYGLQNNCRTILIFGGSQGAQMINQQILKSIPFLRKEKIQVIHFTGTEEFVEPLKSLYALYEIPSIVKAFEKEMWKAWCAADLFIGRSGASTIAESTAFEVPGILIPYPFAAEKHQEVNARFFVDSMKGGEMLLEERWRSSRPSGNCHAQCCSQTSR